MKRDSDVYVFRFLEPSVQSGLQNHVSTKSPTNYEIYNRLTSTNFNNVYGEPSVYTVSITLKYTSTYKIHIILFINSFNIYLPTPK